MFLAEWQQITKPKLEHAGRTQEITNLKKKSAGVKHLSGHCVG